MKPEMLEKRMRAFETMNDPAVLPGIWMVARIDGRGFTRLTKRENDFEKPFDGRFSELMVATLAHLMQSGFKVIFGYTQSDEISLLFDFQEDGFERKIRKFNSILAGEASAKFSAEFGKPAAFDCRIVQLPRDEFVVDYFRWRSADAFRNALSGYCYWKLREEGLSGTQATRELNGLSVAEKNEFLFQRGINFNDVPAWQKRGIGIVWEEYEKTGVNPKTGETKVAIRRRMKQIDDLPVGEGFGEMVRKIMVESLKNP